MPGADLESDAIRILGQLAEGVVVVDANRRVQWVNAAARLMVPVIDQPVGRGLVEVVRDHRLDALVERAQASGFEPSLEFELPCSAPILQARAVPWPAPAAPC